MKNNSENISYDRLGRRKSKTADGIKTYFAYDKDGRIIAEYEVDSNEVVWKKNYVYGAKSELIYVDLPMTAEAEQAGEDFLDFCTAWLCYPYCDVNNLYWDYNSDDDITFLDFTAHANDFDLAFNKNDRYVLTDLMGSVIGIVDQSSNVVEVSYDAWGNPSYEGDLDGINILWNGYYHDDETGNYYLRNRYYSPLERKFLTDDPRGINPDGNWENPFAPLTQHRDGFGLPVYCQGDPINNQDPWGLKSVCCKINTTKYLTATYPTIPPSYHTHKKTTCSQHTMNIGQGGASPKAACECKYRNFPNIEVYGAHEDECCSCTIKMNHFGFYFPTSHRDITIQCTNGMNKTIGLFPDKQHHDEDWENIRIKNKIEAGLWPSGTIRTSCEKVDSVLNSLVPIDWSLIGCGDSMNCIGFAHDLYNQLDQCP